MSHQNSNATIFDELSDDVLGNILLFCQVPSALHLARGTCKNLRSRSEQWSPIWKAIYGRHGFFPPEEQHNDDNDDDHRCDYLMLCQKKRQLLSNLMQNKRVAIRKGQGHSLSLPNRYFHFMPILPSTTTMMIDDDNAAMMDDPPPVFYECDSFVLTSGGTNPELLFLDPFDGSLSVFQDFLQQVNQYSTDATSTIESEFTVKNGGVVTGINPGQDPAMTTTNHNSSRHEHLEPKIQCLLEGNEYFELNLTDYFPHHRARITEEFEMNYGGIEAKPVWRESSFKSYDLVGYVVGVARCVRSLDNDSIVCTELTTWTRSLSESMYTSRRLCRLACHYELAELDACHSRVLVSIVPEVGGNIHTISVYPLVDWQGETVLATSDLYFPKSLFSVRCKDAIATFTLDATGQTLLVATKAGAIELWTLDLATAHRQEEFQILSKLSESIDEELTRRTSSAKNDGKTDCQINHRNRSATCHDGVSEIETSRCSVLRRQPDLPQFHSPIQSFFVPKHLPVERSGFLTLHHNRDEGSSLLLWKLVKNSWEVVSLIHLRLSSRRRPYIAYDGHRIIVFGEDHIGPIILVYQVLNSDDEVDFEMEHQQGEASGGVYHLTYPHAVRFANRVRHVALGGIDALDSIHMTCNERFIIVNTRMGNHLGTSPCPEGLLVIDLEDNRL